ncbi:MAG: hypothetical protein AAF138_07510 [Planctomycetota bacterium]
MNWFVFAIASWIAFGLELGARDVLQIGPGGIAPSFVIPLAVFVALWAPATHALWACLALGVLADLTWHLPRTDGGIATILGPYAIGYTLLGALVINMRGMMIRRNPITMAFLCVLGSLVAQIAVVALFTVRRVYGDPIAWDAGDELLTRALASVYTGGVGLIVSLALFAGAPLFQFQQAGGRRPAIRRS